MTKEYEEYHKMMFSMVLLAVRSVSVAIIEHVLCYFFKYSLVKDRVI